MRRPSARVPGRRYPPLTTDRWPAALTASAAVCSFEGVEAGCVALFGAEFLKCHRSGLQVGQLAEGYDVVATDEVREMFADARSLHASALERDDVSG